LTPLGAAAGLVSIARQQRLAWKEQEIRRLEEMCRTTRVGDQSLEKLLRRPEFDWAEASRVVPEMADVEREIAEQVEYDIKYSGYISRQAVAVDRQQRLAARRIPTSFDYEQIVHLRREAKEKLTRIRPESLDQASRISGITPADITLLMIHLEGRSRP
jgi:tRNA uridine 5-carboxymethylaminomethyl modification enzyme